MTWVSKISHFNSDFKEFFGSLRKKEILETSKAKIIYFAFRITEFEFQCLGGLKEQCITQLPFMSSATCNCQ